MTTKLLKIGTMFSGKPIPCAPHEIDKAEVGDILRDRDTNTVCVVRGNYGNRADSLWNITAAWKIKAAEWTVWRYRMQADTPQNYAQMMAKVQS